ncbi:carbon starvation CstA family protein [Desulfovirgula thermocuniculi]|uniref:carbon starvation CstA family protein n=1 Tax=Desulfovirgula thermocuniculi TaxID=348842 RepID=UPI00041F3B9F|nr:carbon starvation CstA family protein [Desulfovirgula thermocuniculi]
MNPLVIILLVFIGFFLAYRYYSGYIKNVLGEDDSRPTPAVEICDDKDYCPSNPLVVFSHHFASIAGAGPILGPTMALAFGYMPTLFWIFLGTIFIGAVHDYTSLFVSMREKGRSMAEVAGTTLGRAGYLLFVLFTLFMIVLVTSAFLGLTATALSSLVPVSAIGVDPAKTALKVITHEGTQKVVIGGIASTSVIIITLFSPLIGYLLYRRRANVYLVALLAIAVGVVSVIVGMSHPVMLNPKVWMVIISIYVLFAAGIPVWIILQPRDFTNAFLLYGGLALLFLGALLGGFGGLTTQAPAYNIAYGVEKLGLLWPFLFITVACGAISGFHSLVAGGTSSKQVARESHARKVGYGGMILEGILATLVVVAVATGIGYDIYKQIVWPTKGANVILGFSLGMGGLLEKSLGIPIVIGTVFGILMLEGFIITTLDTAVRLNRYLFEELWSFIFKEVPPLFKTFWFNSGLSVLVMFYLGYTNAYTVIWPIFGSANQLLSGLALIAVSTWLAYRGKPSWFTVLPAAFMMCTTLMALYKLLVTRYLPTHNYPLVVTDIALMVLALAVIVLAVKRYFDFKKASPAVEAAK